MTPAILKKESLHRAKGRGLHIAGQVLYALVKTDAGVWKHNRKCTYNSRGRANKMNEHTAHKGQTKAACTHLERPEDGCDQSSLRLSRKELLRLRSIVSQNLRSKEPRRVCPCSEGELMHHDKTTRATLPLLFARWTIAELHSSDRNILRDCKKRGDYLKRPR